jgi:alpha-L-rhamnosidase
MKLYLSTILFLATSVSGVGQLRVDSLRCEFERSPLNIDVSSPRFSWQLVSDRANTFQSSYHLQVARSEGDLRSGSNLVLNSGQMKGASNFLIEYNGSPLTSFTRYYWRVKATDREGRESEWSPIAVFETAMLDTNDWKAKWIGDGRPQFTRDEDFYKDDRMPLFKKSFVAKKAVARARIYVAGIGYHEAFLNGKKIGNNILDPGWTTFGKQVLYVTHDITPSIRKGNNLVSVMLGNGWYNPLPIRLFGRFNLRDVQETGRPRLRAQLLLEYTDGSREWINTDESWLTAPGPVIRNNVYLGEYYDARLENNSFYSADNAGWTPAVPTAGPSGVLSAQMQPPVRITARFKPVRITEIEGNKFIVDLGKNFAGVARIRVKGPAGKVIRIKYGEDIHPDGTLNYLTTVAGQIKKIFNLKGGPGAPETAWQEDVYILKGKGTEEWHPRFTFHGFRYLEVTGWPGKLTPDDIEGLRMNSDLPLSGTFSCSNDSLNLLLDVVKRTFLSNVFSVQSDCPGREKMGYGADIVSTAEAFMYNFDMATFYRKTVRDYANDQQPDGGITEIAPYTGIADRGYGGHSGPLGWQLVFPFLQKKLYEFYGDKRIIEQHYPAIVRQMDFLQLKAVEGLFHWDISDHEALDPRPEAFTASAFYYHHAALAAEFAGILDKKDDSTKYAQLAKRIKGLITAKYHLPNTGQFDNGTQSAQLFALWYGFAPDRKASLEKLRSEFERHNWHVSTGIYSTKFMFDILREENLNDWSYKIATQQSFPGWMFMINRGATTLWETWKYPDNAPSQNHPMFGSVTEWMYRSILGINPAGPGFSATVIKPQPTGNLTWAKGGYRSMNGVIEVDWKRTDANFVMKVIVPANTSAEIWIPGNTVTESGKEINGQKGIKFIRADSNYQVFRSGSGTFEFASNF